MKRKKFTTALDIEFALELCCIKCGKKFYYLVFGEYTTFSDMNTECPFCKQIYCGSSRKGLKENQYRVSIKTELSETLNPKQIKRYKKEEK